MTQKNEELLIEDLSCRIPYGVIVNVEGLSNVKLESVNWYYEVKVDDGSSTDLYPISEVRPYLRPMSSMTDGEKEDLKSKCTHTETEKDWEGIRSDRWGIQILEKYDTRNCDNPIWTSTINMDAIDWLNKNHFDYRGLIKKGLAIEAPEGMYNF